MATAGDRGEPGEADTLTAAPGDAGQPAPGGHVGRYTLDRLLGQGGMGVVYAAHDPDLERTVALKLLRGPADDAARARLLREARAMARLTHPNVVTVYEVGTAGQRDFVAMELIDGTSLDQWLAQPRTPDQILDVFVHAARGLIAAHQRDLVHRDFKPHNVLIGRDGRVVVTDFGLARASEVGPVDAVDAAGASGAPPPVSEPVSGLDQTAPAAGATPPVSGPVSGLDETAAAPPVSGDSRSESSGGRPSWAATLTATGALVGTPAYMAPEQWRGDPPDPRSDQFSFCVSLWEALAGTRPFTGRDHDQLRTEVEAGPPADARGLPPWLIPIVRRGLAPRSADRWPSMTALVARIVRGQGRRRRRWLVAGGVAVLAAAGAATVAVTRPGPRAGGAGSAGDGVCAPLDQAVVDLWGDARRARIHDLLATAGAAGTRLDRFLTQLTTGWRDAYQRACGDRTDHDRLARIACLDNWREGVSTYLEAIEQMPAPVVQHLPVSELIPRFDACLRPNPVMPPPPPSAQQRAEVHRLRAQAALQAFWGGDKSDAAWSDLERQAEAVGYQPLSVELHLLRAARAHRLGDLVAARAGYEQVAIDAEAAGILAMRANALGGVIELDIEEHRPDAEVDAHMAEARAALRAAGQPVMVVAMLDGIEVLRATKRGDHDRAIAGWADLLSRYAELDVDRRAAYAAANLARQLVARGNPGDREQARAVLDGEIERERAAAGADAVHVPGLEKTRTELGL